MTRKGSNASMTRDELKLLVARWADAINVSPRRVQVQSMRRKWASCSTAGTISFSSDLLCESASFREYVVVHELLHLVVPNHGRVFRALLRVYLPKWRIEDGPDCGFSRVA
jgi:predicted metal-dependent hydrolase